MPYLHSVRVAISARNAYKMFVIFELLVAHS